MGGEEEGSGCGKYTLAFICICMFIAALIYLVALSATLPQIGEEEINCPAPLLLSNCINA